MGTEFFTSREGVTSIDSDVQKDTLTLNISTTLPRARARVSGQATFDQEGLVLFSGESAEAGGSTQITAERSARGIEVRFSGRGSEGSVRFAKGAYDLTSLDLLALEGSDVAELAAAGEVAVLDLFELEIFRAAVSCVKSKEYGRAVDSLELDFGDGDVFGLLIDSESGEVLGGRINDSAVEKVSSSGAVSFLASLRR